MKTSAIQFNISLGDIPANLDKVANGTRAAAQAGTRLAVLPEMWSTGYDYKALPELARQTPEVLEQVCALSRETGTVLVGSLPERRGDDVFNTSYVVDKGEVAGRYRKLHLFSVMREDRYLAAGNEAVIVDTSVGRLGLAICYDLRFPELFRKLALGGAEIICLPAEWPKPRQEHWRTLLRARAIENQMFVAACNCCGIQGKLDFFGMSLLIDPWGDVLAEGGETDTVIRADFDLAKMHAFREQIPCFNDRRPEIYGRLD
ncbi:MAG: carbon-nitrogen family hydrolase [Geothermobacteraceae bacterium]